MNNLTYTSPNSAIQTAMLGLVLVIGAISMAHAGGVARPEITAFEQFDSNQDGLVSIQEALDKGMLTNAFEMADSNHDGNLNNDEFAKAELVDEHLKVAHSIDDNVLTAKVKIGLLKNPVVKDLQVHVETYKGIVQLSGFVASHNMQLAVAQIATAGQIAAGIEGVNGVVNNLIVKS